MTPFPTRARLPGTGWLRPAIAGALLVAAAVMAATNAHAGRTLTAENAGMVCFEQARAPGGPNVPGIHVSFFPNLGCLSSSCTEMLESTFNLNPAPGRIDMTSRFRVRKKLPTGPCTDDCGGGGQAFREIRGIGAGIHRVILGGVEIGRLNTAALKPRGQGPVCFRSSDPRPNARQ